MACWYWHLDFSGNFHDSQKHETWMSCMRESFYQCPQRFSVKCQNLNLIYFSISQTTFSTKLFNVFFFLLKMFPNPFLAVNNTFILFYGYFWTLIIFHSWKSFWITITIKGGAIQTMPSYWLFQYFFNTHFVHCRRRFFEKCKMQLPRKRFVGNKVN